jgi:hypothetical protein
VSVSGPLKLGVGRDCAFARTLVAKAASVKTTRRSIIETPLAERIFSLVVG